MSWVVGALQHNPELAIFLTLALGFFIGRLKIGSFSLGTVVGTLLAGVLVGQLGIQVPGIVKTVFFDLFLFTTGYKVGPPFFRGLKKDALSQVAPAGDAINRLPNLSAEEKAQLINNIPVAYAVTYLVGTAVLVWFLPTIGPKLIGVNLREEAKKMQAQGLAAADVEPGVVSAARRFDIRAYRVVNDTLINRTVGQLEEQPRDFRVFVLRLRRLGRLMEVDRTTTIQKDDVVLVAT